MYVNADSVTVDSDEGGISCSMIDGYAGPEHEIKPRPLTQHPRDRLDAFYDQVKGHHRADLQESALQTVASASRSLTFTSRATDSHVVTVDFGHAVREDPHQRGRERRV